MSKRALDGVLHTAERGYVEAINAVLVCRDDGSSVAHRWRGQAEAYRTVCEDLRARAGLRYVRYQGPEWRDANGVYTRQDLARMGVMRP